MSAETSKPIPVLIRLADELKELRVTVEAMRLENATLQKERNHYEQQFLALRAFLFSASQTLYNMNDDWQRKYGEALLEKIGKEDQR